VHELIAERLGVDDARVIRHDFGAAVAFQYASRFPDDTARLGYFDLPRPRQGRPRHRGGRSGTGPEVDVPEAGHWLVEENPRFVTTELLRFLDA
jgi:pimeloyl-ACP methyl ester carboxylesterase